MVEQIKKFAFEPVFLVAAIAVTFLVDFIIPIDFTDFGIHPRSFWGLFGIPLSPFLHIGLGHLFSNLVPLLVLGILVRAYGKEKFIAVTAAFVIVGGLFTWLTSTGIVVGASGLVFAYWTYLITTAIRQKTLKTIFIAGATLVLYGGLIFGLASFREGVSWAGHFGGALAGVIVAFLIPADIEETV